MNERKEGREVGEEESVWRQVGKLKVKSALGKMGSTGRKGWSYPGREVIMKSFMKEAVLKLNIAGCIGDDREGQGEQR